MPIALSSYQVLQLPTPHPAVNHLFDLIPLLSSYNLGWWWWWWWMCLSTFNQIWWGQQEFDDMEDGVEVRP
jgi:hypothetical protein